MLPLPMSNIDTDQIMPKEFLKRVERSGYGEFLFYDWKKDANFPLNNEIFKESKVLLTGTNFGTGSQENMLLGDSKTGDLMQSFHLNLQIFLD